MFWNKVYQKRKIGAALAAAFSLMLANPVYAAWQNEAGGPGAAVWVGEQLPDGTLSEQPAPDAQDQYAGEADHSTTYIGGQPVSITTPDGEKKAIETAPGVTEGQQGTAQETAPSENDQQTAQEAVSASSGTDQQTVQQEENKQPETQTPTAENPQTAEQAQTQTPEQAQTEQTADNPEQDPNLVASGGRMVDLRKPMIALTYDDGPYAPVGNRIMDTLETHNGRATFFMVGDRVKSYATEVRRMASNGHEVANHTYNHKYLNKLDASSIRSQVTKANDVIEAVSGTRPKLMRLPGGNKNQTVLQNVNMPIILWDIDTRDWATKNAQKTIDAVIGKVKDGDIILMHELYSSTADATAAIVPKLAAQGYQFVTVSELARFKGKTLSNNQIYYSIR